MKISNEELITMIKNGKILPGFCKSRQYHQSLSIISEEKEDNTTSKNILTTIFLNQNELELKLNKTVDVTNQSKIIKEPLTKLIKNKTISNERVAYCNKSDIILKGVQILLGINKCGLIGTTFNIPEELKIQIQHKLVGIISKNNKNLDYLSGAFKNKTQYLNFNCIKIVYDSVSDNQVLKNKTVTNVNLYNTNYDFNNVKAPINILPTSLSNDFESLIPITHTDVCVDNILSTETTGKSSELEHTISYSFKNDDNKVSVTVTITNNSKNIIKNLKYYYAMNLNNEMDFVLNQVPRIQTSPHETALFSKSSNNINGIYLRTLDENSSIFIDNNWNWLNNDIWDQIKLHKSQVISQEELAISGLIFNKDVMKPNTSWLINFSLGFTNENDFMSSSFINSKTGLSLKNMSFENIKMNNIITSCADFTGCNLSGIDLSTNNLFGAKTGPLALNSNPPSSLPKGYQFVISKNKNQDRFIIGPNLDLSNCELVGIDFLNISLSGTNLSGTNLLGSNLSNSNLNKIKLSKHDSYNESLILPKSYIIRHNLILGPNIDYSNNDFSNIDLSNLLLSGCNFTNCKFFNTNLSNTNLTDCNFTNIIPGPIKNNFIIDTVLPYNYRFVTLNKDTVCIAGPKVNFSNMNLTNSKLTSVNLSEANFTNAILSGVNMNNVDLTNAITGPMLLDMANPMILPTNYSLISSEISNKKYIVGPNVSLINKDLSNFNLSKVDLSGSKLIFSNLTGTDLSYTNLENTCLPTVIGPLKQKSDRPINYEKIMSFKSLGKENWLIYNWDKYKWDYYATQLYKSITH